MPKPLGNRSPFALFRSLSSLSFAFFQCSLSEQIFTPHAFARVRLHVKPSWAVNHFFGLNIQKVNLILEFANAKAAAASFFTNSLFSSDFLSCRPTSLAKNRAFRRRVSQTDYAAESIPGPTAKSVAGPLPRPAS